MLLLFQRPPLARRAWAEAVEGFTLIELLVVTALISIMLAFSIPSLRTTFFTDPLKDSTRKLIGLVTGIRELAVRTQQPYLLHIDRLENKIWYEQERGAKENKDTDTADKRELVFPDVVKITGVAVSADSGSSENQIVIWIGKQGYIGDTIIRLEDKDGQHLNVRFYPFIDPALVSDEEVPF